MKKLLLLVFLTVPLILYSQKFENLALTPPIGWNSWNTFGVKINEQLIMEMTDILVESGMKEAGYEYIERRSSHMLYRLIGGL